MDAKFPKVSIKLTNRRMKDLISDELTDWIMDGRLQESQRLREDDLAEAFGVSRMPVREALHSLEAKGLVEMIPYIGASVRHLETREVQEIYTLRCLLEPLACERAAINIAEGKINELQAMQDELEHICNQTFNLENRRLIYQKNRDFHMAIYNVSHMEILLRIINNLWDNIAFVRIRSAYSETYPEQMTREHRDYIHLLTLKDGKTLSEHVYANLQRHAKYV